MSLDRILSTLEAEGKKGDPKHNRRLRFMNEIRRGSDSHSDYMSKLLEASRIIEFEGLTLDELIIHIFIRDADATMGKAAQDALMEKTPNVYNVVNLIKQYESQSWYNPKKKEYGRMASSRTQRERYCKGCDSNTHDESACWGVCPHCNQRGHQAIYCRKKKQ